MLLTRGRAAFVGIFLLAWGLPSCFGTDGANSNDDDDDDTSGGADSSGGTGGSSATGGSSTGGTEPGTGGTGGSGATGGSGGGGTSGAASGSGGAGGNVVPPPAGNGGTGGSTSGTGGSAGSSGTAGMGGTPGAIGSACTSASDCDSGFCLTTESTELDGAGPAGGLCTVACADQAACDADAPGTLCVQFTDTAAFCLETCEPGAASEPKCQSRPDVACLGVATEVGTTACTTIEDCAVGQVCIAAEEDGPTLCSPVVSACTPSCGGDFECASGQYCDLGIGMCLPGSASGEPIGAPCDPAAEVDPCSGFCIAVSETEGMCSGGCSFNTTLSGCGFDGSTTPAEAICLFSPAYVDTADVGAGDSGLCGPLCDCNDDCGITGWACFDIEMAIAEGAAEFFGRAGLCRALADDESLSDGIVCEQ